jgi:hypothetical protein
MTGFGGIGDIVNARRGEGLNAFNGAAFDDALAPIGATTNGVIGAPGVGLAQDATRQGYRGALSGVSVTPDAPFATDMGNALAAGRSIPRTGDEFGAVVDRRVAPLFNSPTGAIDGPGIQDILQTVKKTDFGNDAMGGMAGDALNGVGDAVRGLVGRQAPEAIGNLQNADRAYRLTGIVRDAVNAARNGSRSGEVQTFVPSQLADSAAANARRFDGTQATTSQPFYDLTTAGQRVLPSKIPDSGTAGRLAMASLPLVAGGTGGGVGYLGGDAKSGAGLGVLGALALAAGGTRTGQRALTAALLDRPDFAVRIGNQIYRRQGMFGSAGVPLALGLQSGQ